MRFSCRNRIVSSLFRSFLLLSQLLLFLLLLLLLFLLSLFLSFFFLFLSFSLSLSYASILARSDSASSGLFTSQMQTRESTYRTYARKERSESSVLFLSHNKQNVLQNQIEGRPNSQLPTGERKKEREREREREKVTDYTFYFPFLQSMTKTQRRNEKEGRFFYTPHIDCYFYLNFKQMHQR